MSKERLREAATAFASTRDVGWTDERVPRFVSWRVSATASDVVTGVELLLGTYEAAQGSVVRMRERIQRLRAGEVVEPAKSRHERDEDDATRRLISSFVFSYMALRAYQDAVCGVLLALEGMPVGKYTSMNAKTKPGKQLERPLAEHLSGYREWFSAFKEARDQMKMGALFTLYFDAENTLELEFSYPHGEAQPMGVITKRLHLDSLSEGLEMSLRLTQFMWSRLEGVYRLDLESGDG